MYIRKGSLSSSDSGVEVDGFDVGSEGDEGVT